MGRVRTTLFIDEDLAKLARFKAVEKDGSLSDVVEDALKNYLSPAMGAALTSKGTVFHSGPTISQMQPSFSNDNQTENQVRYKKLEK